MPYKLVQEIKIGDEVVLTSYRFNSKHPVLKGNVIDTGYGKFPIYVVGELTERIPRYGPMTVFNTYLNAVQFAVKEHFSVPVFYYNENIKLRLYECEYERSKDAQLWIEGGEQSLNYTYCPHGTILADKVTLVGESLALISVIDGRFSLI